MGVTPCGLLHSEIHGSMPTCGSPWLIAACCVLRRLLVPRHSPCALSSLTFYARSFDSLDCSFRYPNIFACALIFVLLKPHSFPFIQFSTYILPSLNGMLFKTAWWAQCGTPLERPFPNSLAFCYHIPSLSPDWFWWAQVDSNHRPHAYQACALTA